MKEGAKTHFFIIYIYIYIYIYISLSFLFLETKCETDTGRRRTKDLSRGLLYWLFLFLTYVVLPYLGPHLALRMLLSRGDYWPPRVSVSYVTAWLTIATVGACIYDFTTPKLSGCQPIIRFHLSTRVSSLHTRITVFLFTQLDHDGSVKVIMQQSTLFLQVSNQIWKLRHHRRHNFLHYLR